MFGKKGECLIDSYDKPSLYVVDNLVYLKFSELLNNEMGDYIKFTIICVLDKEQNIIELRFDRVGIAYKNTYNFYRDNINNILDYLRTNLSLEIENIDFKSVNIKSEKENISIYAQRMQRNGTTAYLEAYDDGDGVMPILGELGGFIEENFMYYGELLGGKEMMSYVRNYLIGCNRELENCISSDCISE